MVANFALALLATTFTFTLEAPNFAFLLQALLSFDDGVNAK
jgi:hypothetical protein